MMIIGTTLCLTSVFSTEKEAHLWIVLFLVMYVRFIFEWHGLTPPSQDIECMPLNPVENMPANLSRHGVTLDKIFGNLNEVKINGLLKEAKIEDYIKSTSNDKLESTDGSVFISPSTHHINKLIKQAKVSVLLLFFFELDDMH